MKSWINGEIYLYMDWETQYLSWYQLPQNWAIDLTKFQQSILGFFLCVWKLKIWFKIYLEMHTTKNCEGNFQ